MTKLHERIETTLPIDEAFAFVADFANAERWDPGVESSVRIGSWESDGGPPGVGVRYRLGVRMGGRVAPMEYEVTTWDPPNRVVLTGHGSGVAAVDDIRFETSPSGTTIDYVADIRLGGLMRLISPFLGGAFAKVGRDAREGMQRTLAERAAAR